MLPLQLKASEHRRGNRGGMAWKPWWHGVETVVAWRGNRGGMPRSESRQLALHRITNGVSLFAAGPCCALVLSPQLNL